MASIQWGCFPSVVAPSFMIFSVQDEYGDKTGSSLVKIAQIGRMNPIAACRAYRLCDSNGIGGFTLSDMLAREAGGMDEH
jgi:hypothetical protein